MIEFLRCMCPPRGCVITGATAYFSIYESIFGRLEWVLLIKFASVRFEEERRSTLLFVETMRNILSNFGYGAVWFWFCLCLLEYYIYYYLCCSLLMCAYHSMSCFQFRRRVLNLSGLRFNVLVTRWQAGSSFVRGEIAMAHLTYWYSRDKVLHG